MAERRVAFILAGGASRGAYQAGAIKRLDEEGVKPSLIVGSSIGVCNSLIYVSGGADALWGVWSRTVSLPQLLDVSLRRNPLFGNSLFSMGRLQRTVEREVDFDRCFGSPTELTYLVTNLSAGREELRGNRTEDSVERFRAVTRMGYAVPILHPLVELDGDLYADGGFLWTVPFEYAAEAGATDIYILSVVPASLPRAGSLRFIPQVAARLYDVFWRTVANSAYVRKRVEEARRSGIRVTVVEPGPESGGFDPLAMLNAHPSKSRRLLWDGYRDAECALRAAAVELEAAARGQRQGARASGSEGAGRRTGAARRGRGGTTRGRAKRDGGPAAGEAGPDAGRDGRSGGGPSRHGGARRGR